MELGKIQNDEDKACPKWGWGSPDTTKHGDAGRCELPGVTGQVQVHRTSAASSTLELLVRLARTHRAGCVGD